MPGLLIIAHAPLASSFKAVAQHAFTDCARQLEALDVTPNMPVEEIEAQARQLLASLGTAETLVLTDVFGATPCNVAQRLADSATVKVVAGINVPMVWRSLCYADDTLEQAVARAVAGATQGVMQVSTTRPQNQGPKRRNDPEDGQDQ